MTDGSGQTVQHRFRIGMIMAVSPMTVPVSVLVAVLVVCVFDHGAVRLHMGVGVGRMNVVVVGVVVGQNRLHGKSPFLWSFESGQS